MQLSFEQFFQVFQKKIAMLAVMFGWFSAVASGRESKLQRIIMWLTLAHLDVGNEQMLLVHCWWKLDIITVWVHKWKYIQLWRNCIKCIFLVRKELFRPAIHSTSADTTGIALALKFVTCWELYKTFTFVKRENLGTQANQQWHEQHEKRKKIFLQPSPLAAKQMVIEVWQNTARTSLWNQLQERICLFVMFFSQIYVHILHSSGKVPVPTKMDV